MTGTANMFRAAHCELHTMARSSSKVPFPSSSASVRKLRNSSTPGTAWTLMLERLFVYGTLAPGRLNEHILGNVPGTWEEGSVRGHLLQQGWGADRGYPGIVVDPSAARVQGFMLTSDALTSEWERLDDFEGSEYERVVAQVELVVGGVVAAFIYQLKR